MKLTQRLLLGAVLIVSVLMIVAVTLSGQRLRTSLRRLAAEQLSREARIVASQWRSVAEADAFADSAGVALGHRVTLIDSSGLVIGDNAYLFGELMEWHGNNVVKAARVEGLLMPLLELNSQTFIAALLLIGGYRVLNGAMPAGDLITFFFLANIFFSPIQILGNQYNQALTAMAGAERVFGLLDRPPEWQDAPDATPLRLRPLWLRR